MNCNLKFIDNFDVNSLYIDLGKIMNEFYKSETGFERFLDIAYDIESLVTLNKIKCSELSNEGTITVHSANVAILCGKIGAYYQLSSDDLTELILGGLLHDIGKPYIENSILNKPSKLSRFEMIAVNSHEDIGRSIVSLFTQNSHVLGMIKNHHRYIKSIINPINLGDMADKKFYFYPLICSVADITDAILSKRVYKSPMNISVAREDIYTKGIIDIERIYAALMI